MGNIKKLKFTYGDKWVMSNGKFAFVDNSCVYTVGLNEEELGIITTDLEKVAFFVPIKIIRDMVNDAPDVDALASRLLSMPITVNKIITAIRADAEVLSTLDISNHELYDDLVKYEDAIDKADIQNLEEKEWVHNSVKSMLVLDTYSRNYTSG